MSDDKSLNANTIHYLAALSGAVSLGAFTASHFLFGIPFWLALIVCVLALFFTVRHVLTRLGKSATAWINFTTMVLATLTALTLVEVGLAVYESISARTLTADQSQLTGPLLASGALLPAARERMQKRLGIQALPDEWRRESVPGTRRDYYWHEALHEFDDHRFRRKTPFPPKQEGVMRIVVVGDSLTYGAGIAAEFTYSRRLDALLAEHFPVEVLNLGVSGHQSTDVLGKLHRFVPDLAPDLVIYGVCLNDFLPSGRGEYAAQSYPFPLPDAIKNHFIEQSRVGSQVSLRYNQLLISQGLRLSFFDDILRDFEGYQQRFTRDVKAMSDLVLGQQQIPFLSMVLYQSPSTTGQGRKITQIAEQSLLAANIHVIPSEGYFTAYTGRSLRVSRWEGHPNELANALFASLFYREITQHFMPPENDPQTSSGT